MSAESSADLPELILAFDYGLRRIGVASGNRLTATASPLAVVSCRDTGPDWQQIDRLVAEWGPRGFVVGQPPKGSEELLKGIENFVQALTNRYKLPAWLVDESLSSAGAAAQLAAQRRDGLRKRRVKRGDTDKLAACLIAQRWLTNAEPNA